MKKTITLFLISSIFILSSATCLAAGGTAGGGTPPPDPVELDDPLGNKTPEVLIGNVINAVLGIVGSLALAMFIYGGLTWMLAAGNDQRVQKGKDILLWATIGLVVIFSSYALVRFVFVGLGFEYTN